RDGERYPGWLGELPWTPDPDLSIREGNSLSLKIESGTHFVAGDDTARAGENGPERLERREANSPIAIKIVRRKVGEHRGGLRTGVTVGGSLPGGHPTA